MKVSVKVPATTANIGPGFDCLGLALPIYNVITIEETVIPNSGVEINIISDFEDSETMSIPLDENNIAYKAIEILYNSIGQTPSELKITINSKIPIAKGLGSSASVIVGSLIAANEMLGCPADEAALLSIATEVEGHPDNIVPAFLGGLTMASQEEDNSIFYRKIEFPEEWTLTVCVPDYELSTNISRSVIPSEIPLKDVEFNISRMAMFIEALHTKDTELMKKALEDKIHQPYRKKLVPGFYEIENALKNENNILGCVLSGAGPSILIIGKDNNLEKAKQIVSEKWLNLNVDSIIYTLPIEKNGAFVIKEEKIYN